MMFKVSSQPISSSMYSTAIAGVKIAAHITGAIIPSVALALSSVVHNTVNTAKEICKDPKKAGRGYEYLCNTVEIAEPISVATAVISVIALTWMAFNFAQKKCD